MKQHDPSIWATRIDGIARMSVFFLLILILTPLQIYCLLRKSGDSRRIPMLFHSLMIRVLGFKLRTHGTLATNAPVLYVSNHTSYLDIPVLGALIPAAFVAKAEVASWPIFGVLAKLQGTVFIERRSARTSEQSDSLKECLQKGQSLILFPEGTSTVGFSVLPFKSSLFNAVLGDWPVTVQPVSVVCTGLDSMPLTRDLRPLYAWYGDMTLLPHLWNVFKIGRFTIDILFHPPVSPKDFSDRKALAAYCQAEVARGIEKGLTGRGMLADKAVGFAPKSAALIDAKN